MNIYINIYIYIYIYIYKDKGKGKGQMSWSSKAIFKKVLLFCLAIGKISRMANNIALYYYLHINK